MTRRTIILTSMAMALLVFLPVLSFSGSSGGIASEAPPSRYGFTLDFKTVADPASELLSVAIGDVDG